ncbi:MAG: DNA recombination protein RmuC, partial [Flavobacteriales bacterium]
MINITLLILSIFCTIVLIYIAFSLSKKNVESPLLSNNQDKIREDLSRLHGLTTEEMARNRKEGSEIAQNNRQELQKSLAQNRQELSENLGQFEKTFGEKVNDFNDLQKIKFDDLVRKQEQIRKETEERLSQVRETVEKKLSSIQEDNEKRLEKMRQTVDEKLQETLDKRLSESFKLVGERLEAVQKGLGDMQQLANGVGDLKKVLTNVKTRGTLGEIQLGNILEQIMAPEQYAANVKTKKGSDALVEYVVKLPG